MFICAGNGEEFDFAQSIGVGLVESAINLTRLCQREKPAFLIFVGSAGSYDPNLPLLEFYLSKEATQIEQGFLLDQSYTPIAQSVKSVQKDVSYETIDTLKALKFPQVIVNSSNYITTDLASAQAMCKRGILLENMEFFSVLSVANTFCVPASGVFCVSNYCHPKAHEEFVRNRGEVMGRISEMMIKIKIFDLNKHK